MVGQPAFVLDALGPHCELDGRDSLMDVCFFEGAGGDDAGAASSGERVLEDPGEFGVAVGHVFCSCGQRRYHIAQAGEREVDFLGLF